MSLLNTEKMKKLQRKVDEQRMTLDIDVLSSENVRIVLEIIYRVHSTISQRTGGV